MKTALIVGALGLFLAVSPAFAQHEGHEKQGHGQHQGRSGKVGGRGGRSGERRTGGGRRLNGREFGRHFGPEHRFRPRWAGGYGGFYFGGFNFVIIGEYPVFWGYDADLIVVDLDGAYFVENPLYPGVQVAVEIR